MGPVNANPGPISNVTSRTNSFSSANDEHRSVRSLGSGRGSRLHQFGRRHDRRPNTFYDEIDEAMNSSVEHSDSDGEENKDQEESKANEQNYFDGKARRENVGHIDLKDLREEDFLDLIAAKN